MEAVPSSSRQISSSFPTSRQIRRVEREREIEIEVEWVDRVAKIEALEEGRKERKKGKIEEKLV